MWERTTLSPLADSGARDSSSLPDIYYPPLVAEIKQFMQTLRSGTLVLNPVRVFQDSAESST